MSKPIIEVRNLTKRYHLGAIGATSLREEFTRLWDRLRGTKHLDKDEFWALRDVSFDVQPGEVVGIIGRNGAGKSTLLKILSRITEPTSGCATMRGRVASLLEVGTGFHPELTGRENVFLNGAILGMTRAEVRRKFDEIVAFSEVEQFIDTPVKRYSSGMYVRLAFSVAAHLDPEVLIIDEVLAVGDASFQKKCLGEMRTLSTREGRTVLFVSHNMPAVKALCQRTILLEHGRVAMDSEPSHVIPRYLAARVETARVPIMARTDRGGNGRIRLTSLTISDEAGKVALSSVSSLRITLAYESDKKLVSPRFLIGVYDENEVGVYGLDSEAAGGLPDTLPAKGSVVCTTGPLQLTAGMCTLNVAVFIAGTLADYVQAAAELTIDGVDFYGTGRIPTREWAIGLLPNKWRLGPTCT